MPDDSNTTGRIGKISEKIPSLYEDGLKKSIQDSGEVLSLIPKTINALLAPLRKWIAQREYNVAETEKLLALKLEKVNADSLVSPEAYIAVPALQAISYCMDSEELRNLYANLLSMSMVKDKKESVHPSFVEIIKQLSPDEARLLKLLSEHGDSYPLIDVRLYIEGGGFLTQVQNFTLLAEGICVFSEKTGEYLDNFSRLKIIDIPFDRRIKDDKAYETLENCKTIQSLINKPVPDGYRWDIYKKKFEITQYGKSFIETCVKGI